MRQAPGDDDYANRTLRRLNDKGPLTQRLRRKVSTSLRRERLNQTSNHQRRQAQDTDAAQGA
jgi:hypothetical protein